jgi:hypothetical protein
MTKLRSTEGVPLVMVLFWVKVLDLTLTRHPEGERETTEMEKERERG